MKNIRILILNAALIGLIAVSCAASAFAQGTWQTLPDGDANQSSPGLHSPNSNLMAQVGEMEVLNGPISFHTRNYLGFGLLANIRQNWQRALSEKGLVATSDQKNLTIEFTIRKDGSLDSRRVAESSGDTALDGTGLDAIAKSAPFTPVPAEFSGEYLKLRCHFYLNPGRRIRSVNRAARGEESTDTAANLPTAGEGTIHGSGGPTRPRLVYGPGPEYSDQARKANVEGTVQLKVTVNENGDVADVQVTKGLGSGLDEKAIAAVRTWKFKPGTKDGTPVSSEISVDVSFHL
jgi:TonB family protein